MIKRIVTVLSKVVRSADIAKCYSTSMTAKNAAEDSIFMKIIRREIPSEIVYEDEKSIAIRDINPQAPVHVLVVPKEPIVSLSGTTDKHVQILGHLMNNVRKIADQEQLEEGYRVGDEKVLNYIADFSRYRLKDLIESCIPYAAALPFKSLDKFRSNVDSNLTIDPVLWMLIFQAKAHRLSYETQGHDLHCISVKSLCVYCGTNQAMLCRNCSRKTCKNCRQKVCCGFHLPNCPASNVETNSDFVAYPCLA